MAEPGTFLRGGSEGHALHPGRSRPRASGVQTRGRRRQIDTERGRICPRSNACSRRARAGGGVAAACRVRSGEGAPGRTEVLRRADDRGSGRGARDIASDAQASMEHGPGVAAAGAEPALESAGVEQERWRRIEAVFQAAQERTPDEQIAFLDRACGEDAELRREVESLLRAATDTRFLESPVLLTSDPNRTSGGRTGPGWSTASSVPWARPIESSGSWAAAAWPGSSWRPTPPSVGE